MSFKSNCRVRIAIVGGGVAGLACAWVLLRRGADVDVFEAGEPGRAALWASGGMLAAAFESALHDVPDTLAELAKHSQSLWKDWAEDLGAKQIGYRAAGVLAPASGQGGAAWLDRLEGRARALGFAFERRTRLPAGMQANGALFFPDDGELDNRQLGGVLTRAVHDAGGRIHANCGVRAVEVCAEMTLSHDRGEHRADAVILATGHEGHGLAPYEPALDHIIPVKGHMLSLRAADVRLDSCIRAETVYLSQKPDARIVVGATSEPGCSDHNIDDTAITALRTKASGLIPSLAEAVETERWCGVRPGTPDGLPILGQGRKRGVFVATGLYRNGVLLAPAAAELMAEIVLKGTNAPEAFAPRRFEP